ncbi:hypothetical protein Afil01_51320 [Actinorhabdospora filicis]|uniref:Mycothiol-dependent maleylpyruvate isomerase metal-binding domain-containing protein n=2 Tax=Actinorhabdospora filicis TaxID=1785913 RepID=A0A9W6SQV6_9ACTN|nr:hypothetical protein Afil01_51320 [Actinorhabdospora filicis]
MYATARRGLIDLASTLDIRAQLTPVPALPGWTVKDTYAHLAGICTDVRTGTLRGKASPDWTARQVADRADLTLAEICAEWDAGGPAIDAILADGKGLLMAQDAWTHRNDIAGALTIPADRSPEACTWSADLTAGYLNHKWAPELPTVVLDSGLASWTIGSGTPSLRLTADPYELARALMGRRSRAQFLGMGWDGDAGGVIERLHAFEMPEKDLTE